MGVSLPANDWTPRDYQLDAWEYMEQGGKHCELIWHRRSGKDELALHWTAMSACDIGHKESIGRVGNYWHCLPKATQARKAIWEAVNPHTGRRRINEVFPPYVRAGTNDHEMLIRFKTGSTWQVVGSDNFDSLVGSPPIGIVFSEWALSNPAAWGYMRPILAENGGWALFNSTPRGRNHAFRTFRTAQREPGHFAQLLAAEATDVFTAEQLDAELRQLKGDYGEDYGTAIFEQEYLCSWDAPNLGAVLGRGIGRAERDGRVRDDVDFDRSGAPIEISSDIGFRDSSAWWFWQPQLGGFTIGDYDVDSGLDAEEWIERLRERIDDRGYNLGRIWLPQDAKSRTFRSKRSSLELFSKAFPGKVALVPPSSVQDRINAARVIVARCEFNGLRCEKGLDGLRSWSYEYDEELKVFSKDPRHDWASHPGDAFSYGAQMMKERNPETIATPKPKATSGKVLYPDMFNQQQPRSKYRYR